MNVVPPDDRPVSRLPIMRRIVFEAFLRLDQQVHGQTHSEGATQTVTVCLIPQLQLLKRPLNAPQEKKSVGQTSAPERPVCCQHTYTEWSLNRSAITVYARACGAVRRTALLVSDGLIALAATSCETS